MHCFQTVDKMLSKSNEVFFSFSVHTSPCILCPYNTFDIQLQCSELREKLNDLV